MARIADLLADGRTFSFEFFPPKTDAAQLSLGRTIAELEPLGPSFVSVTYGAGGSTRQRTHEVVAWVRRETAITPMAHLTCAGPRRVEIAEILASYQAAGIENILALGGDPPPDQAEVQPSDYGYAAELVEDVRQRRAVLHRRGRPPRGPPPLAEPGRPTAATSPPSWRRADFAITQFFFEADALPPPGRRAGAARRDKPVLPGIMPVTNKGQVVRMAELSGAAFPAWLAERLDAGRRPGRGPPHRRRGWPPSSAPDLLEAGAPGLHFYTLNRSSATREIYANLGLPVAAG